MREVAERVMGGLHARGGERCSIQGAGIDGIAHVRHNEMQKTLNGKISQVDLRRSEETSCKFVSLTCITPQERTRGTGQHRS